MGQWQQARASRQPCENKGKQSVLYSVFIVVDDFAQLKVNANVLSKFKLGYGKL